MSERKQNEIAPEAETAAARSGWMTVGTLPGQIDRCHIKRWVHPKRGGALSSCSVWS